MPLRTSDGCGQVDGALHRFYFPGVAAQRLVAPDILAAFSCVNRPSDQIL
jgi:hypothetical protein